MTDDTEFNPGESQELVREACEPKARQTDQSDNRFQSQESLRDLCKLIISLGSGVLAISASFAAKMSESSGVGIGLLLMSWIYLVVSIMSGVKAIDVLADAQRKGTDEWWSLTIRHARDSWKQFRWGLLILVVFGSTAAFSAAVRAGSMTEQILFWRTVFGQLHHHFPRPH